MMIDPTFPLIDLHRHLDGSIRLETILDLGRQHNLPLPAWEIETLRPHVQVTTPTPGVMSFLVKFEWMVGILADYDACRRVAYENVGDAAAEGIHYIELRFSPRFMAEPHGLDMTGVVEAVVAGVQEGARDFGVRTNLIGIISRTYGVEQGWGELDALISHQDHLVGLDLAGDEVNFPASLFKDHFAKARDVGWAITIHAGESAGAESIWQALRDLGASRIGHAVRAIDDPGLIDYMLANQVGIEVNLTSNLQTMTVPDYVHHPAGDFLRRGLLVSLNTDDPGISAIDLPYEYNQAAPAAGLSRDQIHQTQRNALKTAFLSEADKTDLLTSFQTQNGAIG
jgi:adenosine deaminase